jgi:hypothetical protein
MVTEEEPSKAPPHSAVAVATITATCGGLLDSDNGGGSSPSPGSGSSDGAADGKVTVTLGDVGSKPVENVVWRLNLSPNGLTGNKVTKPADGSVDLKFDVVHSRSVETVSCDSAGGCKCVLVPEVARVSGPAGVTEYFHFMPSVLCLQHVYVRTYVSRCSSSQAQHAWPSLHHTAFSAVLVM